MKCCQKFPVHQTTSLQALTDSRRKIKTDEVFMKFNLFDWQRTTSVKLKPCFLKGKLQFDIVLRFILQCHDGKTKNLLHLHIYYDIIEKITALIESWFNFQAMYEKK